MNYIDSYYSENSAIYNSSSSLRLANQIIFIDSQVEDYQTLAKGVKSSIEIVILDRHSIEQITAILSSRSNLTSIHIVSHGSPGCLYLGNTQLSLDTLAEYTEDLKTWFSPSLPHIGTRPLSKSPSLILYGCNVAAGDAGSEFISKLHNITGAEIAASKTLTGNKALGGNWNLEVANGQVERKLAFSKSTQDNYAGILSPGEGIEEPFEDFLDDPLDELTPDFLAPEYTPKEATVTTDLADYAPGSTAIIDGANFEPGETVELQVLHNDGIPNTGGGHESWQVTDGGAGDLDNTVDGNFETTWYVNPDDSANSAFELTATGLDSGEVATHEFTDSVNEEKTFEAGSYVIDMGQDVQTAENTLKGYGLIYELAFNLNVPVQWAIDSEKEFYEPDFTAGGKDYRGGSFVIQEDFITPEVLAIFEDPRFSQVSIDQVSEEFTAPIFDEITSFPKAVLDLQNGGLAIPYFENAGILPLDQSAPDYNPLDEPYVMGTPEDLNGCNDVYVMPHADPDAWPESYKTTMYDFVTEQGGWLWAADHAVSALEVTDIAGFGDRFDLNFLGHDDGVEFFKGDPTGAGRYGGHSGGTLPYEYDRSIASDPEMQVMGLFIDDAITNGSEQIYIPFDADGVAGDGGWLPTTTVAGFDPDHPERFDRDAFPGKAYEAAVLAYGPAFGNEEYGNIMYSGGHSYAKGDGAANIAAQRIFFNFLLQSGRERQPEIDASEFPSEISSGSSQQLKVTVDSPHGTLTEFKWESTDGVSSFTNQTIQIDPVTGETVITADFTLNSDSTIVTIQVEDGCGRQSIHSQVFVDPPPIVDLDGDNSTTTDNNFLGTYRGGGVPVAVTDIDVTVADDSSFIESANITLANRIDGADEFLLIDTTAGGEVAGIMATDDGNGGFVLSGRATQGDYQKIISTLQYQNDLDIPTETDRQISIEVVVDDGISESEIATSTLTLDNAPLANDDAYITDVDVDIAIADTTAGLVSNDLDPEGTDLSVSANTEPSNGSVSVNPNGTLNYAPNAGFTGKDTFEYTVVDAVGNETNATVDIYVNPTGNNPPDAVDDTGYSTPGGVSLTVDAASGILTNDTHPVDSDTDDVAIDRTDSYSANGGTVIVNPDGSFEYNPSAGFQGTDTFTYTISDGKGGADTATVEIEVTNAPPEAVDDAYDGGFDTPLTVAVEDGILNNDSDPTDDPFTMSAFDSVSANGGTVSVNPDGSFEYNPPAGFEGTDTFNYTIAEAAPLTGADTATVTIEVVRPPVAKDNYHGTDKNSSLTIDILGNDTTSSVFDTSSVAIVPGSESWDTNKDKKPKLTVNADGTVDFGFFEGKTEFDKGTYTFDYTVADETGQTTTATVLVVVADKNDPAGVPDFATTSVGTPVTINITDNDYTENNPAGWNSLEIRTDPDNGTVDLQINDNGTPGDTSDDYPEAVYTPNAGFTGTDTFEYRVEEGDGDRTEETLVTIDIADQQPTAGNDAVTVDEDSTGNIINVIGNDFEGDAPVTITDIGTPANGTAIIVDNQVEYTPEPNFNGVDSFAYTITDSNGDTSTANVSVTVDPINDLPVATDNNVSVELGATVNIDVTGDDDFGGDGANSGAIAIETDPTNGTAVVNNNNTPDDPTDDAIDYTHSTGTTDSFTYTITDSNGDTSTATVNVTVNNPPIADDDSYSLDTDATPELTIAIPGVLDNDTDPDSDPLTVDSFDATTSNGGTVDLQPDGSFVYTPVSGFIGQDTFTYIVSDGNGGNDTAKVTIDVAGTPNTGGGTPPQANSDSAIATQEVNVEIDVLGNDTTDSSFDPATVEVISGTESWNTGDTKQSLTVDPATGNFTFNSEDNGEFSFSYQVADSSGNLTSAQVNIQVSGDGTEIISSPDNATTNAQTPVTINLTDNDASPVDGWNTPEVRTDPNNGSVELQVNDQGDADPANDTVEAVYVPNPGFIGTDTFEYRAEDSNGNTLPDTFVTVNVEPATSGNQAIAEPTAEDNSATVNEDSIDNPLAVLYDDNFGTDGASTGVINITTDSTNGTATVNDNATPNDPTDDFIEYSPDADFNGVDQLTYQIADATGDTAEANLDITITPVNDLPQAEDDSAVTDEGVAVNIPVVAGDGNNVAVDDFGGDGAAIDADITITADPTNGMATVNDNSTPNDPTDDTIDYTPDPGFNGADKLTYQITDANGDTSQADVNITVNDVNNLPQTDNETATTDEDVAVNINVIDGDDFGLDGASIGTIEVTTAANNGTAMVNDNGTPEDPTDDSIDYTPGKDFSGTDNFEYTITDSDGDTSIGQVEVTVNPLNDAPNAIANNYTGNEDTDITGNAIADGTGEGIDSDIDGDDLSITINTDPANGTVTVNPNGDFTYTPNPNFNGTDSFSYTITDGNEESSALVNLTIDPVDDLADAIADGTIEVDENSIFNPIPVLDNDLGDADLTIQDFVQPANGFVRFNENETPLDTSDDFLEYSPDRNHTGVDSFDYTIVDADGQTDSATVSINVNNLPNEAPVANPDAITVDAATAAAAGEDLTFNDSDPNNDPLSILQVEFNGNVQTDGEAGISGNYGEIEWAESGSEADYELDSDNPAVQALNIGDSLTEEFIYTLQDPDGATSTATFTVTILKSNKNPVANNDNYTATDEDAVTTFTTSILANDTDTDPGQTLSVLQVNGEPVNVGVPFEVSSGALVTINNDNTVTYDPNGGLDYLNDGEEGIDVFQYSISDDNPANLGGAGIDSALVTVTAVGTNDAPIINLDPDNSGGGANNSNFENTFTEELSSVSIMDSDITIYDPDNEDFASVTLTISGLVDDAAEILNISGTPFSLNGNTSNTVTVGNTTFEIEVTGGGNIVTLTNADAGLDLPRNDLQELLRGITYRNNSDDPTSGERTIEIVTNDGNLDSAVVTSTISVQPVNDPPTVLVPDAQIVSEATPLPLSGISFGDLDAGSDPVDLTLNVSNGVLTLDETVTDGLIAADITDNGTASITLRGTIDQINNTLTAVGGLSYLADNGFSGEDNLQIVINDGGNNGVDPSTVSLPDTADATSEAASASIPITVSAIANDPADAIANSYSTNEETDVSGNLITDDDNGVDSGDIPLSITGNTNPANGTVTVGTNGDFTYTPDADFVGTDTFTYTLLDNDGDADTASVSITVDPVNDAPENTIPGEQSLLETETVVFNTANGNALSIADLDADDSDVQVTLTATNGTLTALGDTTSLTSSSGVGTNAIVLEGSQSLINTALEGLTYIPDDAGAGSIEIKTNDLGNTGIDPSTVSLPDTGDAVSEQDLDTVNITTIAIADLNTPPVNTVPVAQTTGESAPDVFQDLIFSTANNNAITVTDAEADTETIEVTLTATNGILNLATIDSLNITSGADNSETVTVEGTVNDINTALEGLSYSPTAVGSGSVQIKTNDLGVAGIDPSAVGQADTGSNSDERDIDTVNITTVPFENINQAPVNTIPTTQATAQGADLVFNSNNDNLISINDADAGDSNVRVILTAIEGDLTALGDDSGLTSAAGVGTNEVTLIGSQTSINIALEGLTYSPTGTGTGSIEIETNDLGNIGDDPSTVSLPNTADANSEQDTDSFEITIETVSAPLTLDLDGDNDLTGNDYNTNYSVGGSPIAIADDVLIGDLDDANLQSATIYLKTRPDGDAAESLIANGALPGGITTTGFDDVTGILELTGDASIADYQTAIAQIEYTNSIGFKASDRLVEVMVNDGITNSNIAITTIEMDYPPFIDLDGNDSSFV